MADELTAAQVTGLFSVIAVAVTGLAKIWYDNSRRVADRKQQMERYIGPLIHATNHLQGRLFKAASDEAFRRKLLRDNDDSEYYDYIRRNTAFLIAQFFAWAEIIRVEVYGLDIGGRRRNSKLAKLMDEIYDAWQTERFGRGFRIFAGDQRAIGEAMTTEETPRRCIGYGEFLRRLDADDPILRALYSKIDDTQSLLDATNRLAAIQCVLLDVLKLLDPRGVYWPIESYSKVGSPELGELGPIRRVLVRVVPESLRAY